VACGEVAAGPVAADLADDLLVEGTAHAVVGELAKTKARQVKRNGQRAMASSLRLPASHGIDDGAQAKR
jgi:hypothetical protein